MRVIAGSLKGHRLNTLPEGGTIPTKGMVKEAMFSIINMRLPDSICLDLFAGSGALGIEAISRGARHCDFIDSAREAYDIVKQNLEKTKVQNAEIYCRDSIEFLQKTNTIYDIIFIDPPYNSELAQQSIDIIAKRELLSESGVIICELPLDKHVSVGGYAYREKKYGKTKLFIFEANK